MKLVQRIFWLHALLAAGGVSVAFAITGEWRPLPIFLAILALWVLAQARAARGLGGVFLFLLLMAGVMAIFMGMNAWLVLLSAVAALGAWDLEHFLRRMNAAGQVALESGLIRAHLLRLALVEGAGLLAAGIALSARLRLPFWWEVLLVILALIGLGRLIEYTRGQAEDGPTG